MSPYAVEAQINPAVLEEAVRGLLADPKTLSPWLFYDEAGSRLFEEITLLPEYYLTRTERGILGAHADEIVALAAGGSRLALVELGAGTATKTGLLLAAVARRQGSVLYQPVDVSESALAEACIHLEATIAGVLVQPRVANYTAEPLRLHREAGTHMLALFIGSSIGNFDPADAREVLANLRSELKPGDSLLLGTDLVKEEAVLVAAYDDAAGTTAAFNRNILIRLNREAGADFHPECFTHQAIWNARQSRMEMHLVSKVAQRVTLPWQGRRLVVDFAPGETIHTENSYKFTPESICRLLDDAGFHSTQAWHDPEQRFAVTLAAVV